jgi:N,N'-diacetyllegionaminate synthase
MAQHIFIIAEAGVNHNGCLDTAKKLVDAAKEAGADAVKFQTFKTESLVSKIAPMAKYQENSTSKADTQYSMLKKLELNSEEHIDLLKYCKEKGILFLSTAFDLDSIDLLEKLEVTIHKIPSGEITNLPYIEKIARTNKPVIISTGMCEMVEIEKAIEILKDNGTKDITVLHCNTEYPTPLEDVNLKAMNTIGDKLGVKIGYSDHTLGIEVSIAAAALGAVVIEKHFTLDKNMAGPDHIASLEPDELKKMVSSIRNIEISLGNVEKRPSASEIKNRDIARKSIIAKVDIKKGEILTQDNLTVKRPGNGITPMMWYNVLGLPAVRDFCEDEMIEI